jgi:hypothetical protein
MFTVCRDLNVWWGHVNVTDVVQGETVVFGYIEVSSKRYNPNMELWVGGRRGDGSDSDWGEHLRTTGPGHHTTLDLTHVWNSLGRMTY